MPKEPINQPIDSSFIQLIGFLGMEKIKNLLKLYSILCGRKFYLINAGNLGNNNNNNFE